MLRVAQLGHGGGFLFEPAEELGIARQVRVDHLDRHDTLQVGVVGFVNRRHAALPEQLVDAVAPAQGLPDHLVRAAHCRHSPAQPAGQSS